MFFKGSRYAKVEDSIYRDGNGREIRYKKTRFIPKTPAQAGHLVEQGDRLDRIANRYYRDPERFWRVADANSEMWPDDLLRPGRVILIPPAE